MVPYVPAGDTLSEIRLIKWAFDLMGVDELPEVAQSVLLILFVLFGILLAIRVTKEGLDLIAQAKGLWANGSFRFGKLSPEDLIAIRRRQQFCRVLRSDLDALNKAESWNDQYFSELEAEVEAHGHYYATAWDRLLGRTTTSLRRLPSLIQAVEQSSEQFQLIVGEPGSGKSVALRHLALQQAERAACSSNSTAVVPLYINLREFSPDDVAHLTPDVVRSFVIENTRRGDADTAEYIRTHWDDFRDKGLWFFLFDSFDEIPAVLHAPSGSAVIRQFSEAIRGFLAGMSSCKGVVASREFKGPDTLPWPTLRIQALNISRQLDLIENSFLNSEQQEIVRRYVASGHSSLSDNPLFLSLICRFAKEHNDVPSDDHGLLLGHIKRLSERDSEYLQANYQLTSAELVRHSRLLASMLARESSLSLSPTFNEIAAISSTVGVPAYTLQNILSALVYVKIARSDVREAKPGDRRFAFAHRRYQESLFVEWISENPNEISSQDLVRDERWREYTVALLQSQPAEVVKPVSQAAIDRLISFDLSGDFESAGQSFESNIGYFKWSNGLWTTLLLLSDGFENRSDIVPDQLRSTVSDIVLPRWQTGDLVDRRRALRLSSLLPRATAYSMMTAAIDSGSSVLEDDAFRELSRLGTPPPDLVDWFNSVLSKHAVEAGSPASRLRLEALVGRLPVSTGAHHILRRAQLIRTMSMPYYVALEQAPWNILQLVLPSLPRLVMRDSFFPAFNAVLLYSGLCVLALALGRDFPAMFLVAIPVGLLGAGLLMCLLTRKVGLPNPAALTTTLSQPIHGKFRKVLTVLLLILLLALTMATPGLLVSGLLWLFGASVLGLHGFTLSFFAFSLLVFSVQAIYQRRERKQSRERLGSPDLQDVSGVDLALAANSLSELQTWTTLEPKRIVPDTATSRKLARLLLAIDRDQTPQSLQIQFGGVSVSEPTPWEQIQQISLIESNDQDPQLWSGESTQ